MNRWQLRAARVRVAQDPQAVTFKSKKAGATAATYDAYTVTAYRKRLTKDQIEAVGLLASSRFRVWQLWLECLENATPVSPAALPASLPKIGDMVTDTDSASWVVEKVDVVLMGECHDCLCQRVP